ncbi:UV radiation resistance protein and autophagy-related subunit 14-domain-containing protein [Lipomyces oligophaga]|uniref:UV radiation resistance protein and autophagy-related subunit 14-domain-containing protein n=1 Tax=Lipomyces oligophaga TaxID=45792 RepID=UPI0034CE66CC
MSLPSSSSLPVAAHIFSASGPSHLSHNSSPSSGSQRYHVCSLCNQPDSSLACSSCVSATILPDRVSLLSALASRSEAVSDVNLLLTSGSTISQIRAASQRAHITVSHIRNDLAALKEHLADLSAQADRMRSEVRVRKRMLSRATTALKSAHCLQVDRTVQSTDAVRSKASSTVTKLRSLRHASLLSIISRFDIHQLSSFKSSSPPLELDSTPTPVSSHPSSLSLCIDGVPIDNFTALRHKPAAELVDMLTKVCQLVDQLAIVLNVFLPFEIVWHPFGIRQCPDMGPGVHHHASVKSNRVLHTRSSSKKSKSARDPFLSVKSLEISEVISTTVKQDRKKNYKAASLASFSEALSYLVCDIVYLRSAVVPFPSLFSQPTPDPDSLNEVDQETSAIETRKEKFKEAISYLDIGPLLWDTIQTALSSLDPSAETSDYMSDPEFVLVNVAYVYKAFRLKNKIDRSAEWEIVDFKSGFEADTVSQNTVVSDKSGSLFETGLSTGPSVDGSVPPNEGSSPSSADDPDDGDFTDMLVVNPDDYAEAFQNPYSDQHQHAFTKSERILRTTARLDKWADMRFAAKLKEKVARVG